MKLETITSNPTTISTSGTMVQSQHNTISAPISLPTCLVPMGTIGINVANMSTASVAVGPSSLFSHSYNSPFTYGMPTWTPTPNLATMPTTSGIPPSLFNPASFGMSHIPQPIPSLASGYHPSMSYLVHSGTTQIRYGNLRVPQHSGGYNPNKNYNPGSFNMPRRNTMGVGYNFQHSTPNWGTRDLPGIPFLDTLNLPELTKLTNYLLAHLPQWPPIHRKLPSDIPKFEGKPREDPSNHIMIFHLWCCSNSLLYDNIRLRLFQRTLTRVATKWYIELAPASFVDFSSITTTFLNHFQLLVCYETRMELLTSFKKNDSTHIFCHIHEWRQRRRMIKAKISRWFLVD